MKGQSSFYRVPLYWRPMPTIPVVNLHRLEVGSTAFQGREFFLYCVTELNVSNGLIAS